MPEKRVMGFFAEQLIPESGVFTNHIEQLNVSQKTDAPQYIPIFFYQVSNNDYKAIVRKREEEEKAQKEKKLADFLATNK